MDVELKKHFGGSRLSMLLFFMSWIFLIGIILSFFGRIAVFDPQSKAMVSSRWPWEITIVCVIAWLSTSYAAYLIAEGQRKSNE